MGQILSSNNQEAPALSVSGSAYRYPAKSGNYFADHFLMGGERFVSPVPESYLFGENTELNYLGNRPVYFPFQLPHPNEPVRALRSLVNIRKDTIKLTKWVDTEDQLNSSEPNRFFLLDFVIDADVKFSVTVHYMVIEDLFHGELRYIPAAGGINLAPITSYRFDPGTDIRFSAAAFRLDTALFPHQAWSQIPLDCSQPIPLVVQCCVEEQGDEFLGHSHVLYASLERAADGGHWAVKPLKQKQTIDGVQYLLQEIYGIENKSLAADRLNPILEDDEEEVVEDFGSECVICMVDMRDTMILPCRHMCLCYSCADSLLYQANNCPICRSPFRALLRVRALRKRRHEAPKLAAIAALRHLPDPGGDDTVPAGYEAVALTTLLNGFTPSAQHSDEIMNQRRLNASRRIQLRNEGLTDEAKGKIYATFDELLSWQTVRQQTESDGLVRPECLELVERGSGDYRSTVVDETQEDEPLMGVPSEPLTAPPVLQGEVGRSDTRSLSAVSDTDTADTTRNTSVV